MAVSSEMAPHNLDVVIDFVNTLDVETAEDRIATPAGLAAWLDEQALLADGRPSLRAADVADAVELREALRAVLLAHTRGEADGAAGTDAAGEALERVARRGQLSTRFDPDGSMRIAPRAEGFAGVLARVLVPVAYAAMDGTWQRVKACDADDCLEAFYDQSRNRSGRWCDMALCGNRTKVRTYRTKRTG
jgi:predicted RNA-binding Zn ribbon-like protein